MPKKSLKTSDFDYELPPDRIAQQPIEPRHNSRLLVLWRDRPTLEHTRFWNIGRYLNPGDLLVVNETRVLPARLWARKPTSGRVELLLLRHIDDDTWEALVGGKHVRPPMQLRVEGGPAVEVLEDLGGGRRLIRFAESIEPYLPKVGQMPLPPYIREPLRDPERYQTVFARYTGSAAAPTAGLHFTPELIEHLKQQEIGFVGLVLHIGLDTFAPVTEETPFEHRIHTEWCELSPTAAQQINDAKRAGHRVIAVGTTSVRTLETAARHAPPREWVAPFAGPTDLYILPGFEFRVVDALVTNFHLPRSTLLMLVSAFAGRERILEVYREAIRFGYRFYSFGDAMLIL